jgi:filamentous hemagglutinin family protein
MKTYEYGARQQMNALTHLFVDVKSLTTIVLLIFGSVLLEDSFIFAEAPTAITSTTGVGDLGTKTITQGHTIQITGGTTIDNGDRANLFHSFDQFTVGRGDTAQFLNTTPSLHIDSILSRVTGGKPSSIFGTIDTMSYPGANLFLMNPAGIVFGPNATLHVGGSVALTTADYLRIAQADGSSAGIFRADPRATPQLSIAPVAAFGFLGDNPAVIEVQKSALTIQPGQSISLIGGNITIQAGILAETADPLPPASAPGKQVYIASVASPGEILAATLVPTANIDGQTPEMFGAVTISQGSKIDTSNNDGGTIRIRGGQLIVDDAEIYAGSGGIMFDATSISIKNSAVIGTYTTVGANAGNIVFRAARDIKMDSDAKVESQTFIGRIRVPHG